jgi:hypothetical protein
MLKRAASRNTELPSAYAAMSRSMSAGPSRIVGPSEWPVLESSQQTVFAPASRVRGFTYVVGANLGPGLLLAVAGAFALAWAVVASVRGSA